MCILHFTICGALPPYRVNELSANINMEVPQRFLLEPNGEVFSAVATSSFPVPHQTETKEIRSPLLNTYMEVPKPFPIEPNGKISSAVTSSFPKPNHAETQEIGSSDSNIYVAVPERFPLEPNGKISSSVATSSFLRPYDGEAKEIGSSDSNIFKAVPERLSLESLGDLSSTVPTTEDTQSNHGIKEIRLTDSKFETVQPTSHGVQSPQNVFRPNVQNRTTNSVQDVESPSSVRNQNRTSEARYSTSKPYPSSLGYSSVQVYESDQNLRSTFNGSTSVEHDEALEVISDPDLITDNYSDVFGLRLPTFNYLAVTTKASSDEITVVPKEANVHLTDFPAKSFNTRVNNYHYVSGFSPSVNPIHPKNNSS